MFREVPLPIIRSYQLYIRHWHMLYRFKDSLRAGWGLNCSPILILHASCLQTCITCASAECTVDYSWWWAEELPETCRVSYQNKFGKLMRLFFIIKKNLNFSCNCFYNYSLCLLQVSIWPSQIFHWCAWWCRGNVLGRCLILASMSYLALFEINGLFLFALCVYRR